ncbi:hypothetical protein DL96DRAFT_1713597 [Flagelloscypha sp. PMI_526]|nr:hypothetical protein DL96DRAFT_1713597 [Flagelloscypha sp. PMI_526]
MGRNPDVLLSLIGAASSKTASSTSEPSEHAPEGSSTSAEPPEHSSKGTSAAADPPENTIDESSTAADTQEHAFEGASEDSSKGSTFPATSSTGPAEGSTISMTFSITNTGGPVYPAAPTSVTSAASETSIQSASGANLKHASHTALIAGVVVGVLALLSLVGGAILIIHRQWRTSASQIRSPRNHVTRITPFNPPPPPQTLRIEETKVLSDRIREMESSMQQIQKELDYVWIGRHSGEVQRRGSGISIDDHLPEYRSDEIQANHLRGVDAETQMLTNLDIEEINDSSINT